MRCLLLVLCPAVAWADVAPPRAPGSAGASCLARLDAARRELIRRVPDSVAGSVVEQDDGTLTYVACQGDAPEVDCDMDATIAHEPRASRKAAGTWRTRRKKRATLHEVEWTRSTAGQRATIRYTCSAWPCSQQTRVDLFLSLFRAALDGCLEAGGR